MFICALPICKPSRYYLNNWSRLKYHLQICYLFYINLYNHIFLFIVSISKALLVTSGFGFGFWRFVRKPRRCIHSSENDCHVVSFTGFWKWVFTFKLLKQSQWFQVCWNSSVSFRTGKSSYHFSRGSVCNEDSPWVRIIGKLKSIFKCNIMPQNCWAIPQGWLCMLLDNCESLFYLCYRIVNNFFPE